MDEQEMKRLLKQFKPNLLRLLAEGRKASWVSAEVDIEATRFSRLRNGRLEPTLEEAIRIENLCKRLSKISLVS